MQWTEYADASGFHTDNGPRYSDFCLSDNASRYRHAQPGPHDPNDFQRGDVP